MPHFVWANILPVYLRLLEYYLCSVRTASILSIAHTSPICNSSPNPFKACVRYFLSNFIKLYSFSRYSSFVFPSSPLFLPVSHCFRGWSKINLKVYDVINCLTENLITRFVWYFEMEKRYGFETLSIGRVLNKEHFYGKIMLKMCAKS